VSGTSTAVDVDVEVVVVGGGAMGSSAAWQLASRGRDVLLLERFQPGHLHGASHGASRNFNLAYSEPTYVSMLVESLRLWRELEAETHTDLLEQVGVVNHGPNAGFDAVHSALGAAGLPAEFVSLSDAAARWPGIRFDTRVLFNPQAGRLNADASVAALQAATVARGGRVEHGAHVTAIELLSDDRVRVRYRDVVVTARSIVVAAGAWTTSLLAASGLLQSPGAVAPRLVVTQEQPAHFAQLDDSFVWPGFNHAAGTSDTYDYWYSGIYGLLTPGEGVKAGWHGVGPVVDPDARVGETFDRAPDPVQFAALQRYAREWLPGVDSDAASAISCTYTTAPDSNFVLDRVGPVVVAAGFAGHGFKFVPSVGRILADLVDGKPAPTLFALGAARQPGGHDAVALGKPRA
jgi:sarcosine oxidase